MDDPAFPDSHTTTTTTTTSTVQSPPLTIDKGYITSIPGILRIVEIAVGLLYWILLAAARGYAVGFPLFVGISCWMLTIGFFAIFVLSLDKRVTVINWLLTEMINNLVWTVLHFIGACIVAGRAANHFFFRHGVVSFAAVLGFALLFLYAVSTFFNFRVFQAGGGLARLTGGSGGAGGATTTTTTTTEYPPEKDMDAPPPYTGP
ncbi:CKLF-like MARVEL transmembrane domain-containing protein 8 [Asterias rubens]|uniref:CKLF-like MARVEL transmembrane domain-containing protein 8 n=1 Tax=Asterias rubens TaxID=7604 RepID=UPI0014555050|nr:CKLF-like MARVEL transmembrane domain-containing protein 8 [Asterias rubens]